MIEIKNKKNPIVGYMGWSPSKLQQEDNSSGINQDSHIPGYVGYIPSVKAENLFANTYGKVTQNCHKGNYPKGIEHPPEIKYVSTTKGTYVDPKNIKKE